jgi:Ohr subfamily peroxiredoxin
MKILYTAEATADGGREGRARSSDGVLAVQLAIPTELGGPGGGTNPEQLFAAGYAACFQSAMFTVARRMQISAEGSRVTARVGLGTQEGGAFGLAVELTVSAPGLDHQTATELVERAHQVCPYSNATRGNVEVSLTVLDAAAPAVQRQ